METLRSIARQQHTEEYRDLHAKPLNRWHQYLRFLGIYDELIETKKHQFITIALPLDYSLAKLTRYIMKPHAWLTGAYLTIERYSKIGDNLHIHILKEGYYSKTKIIRDLSRRFKLASNFIDVRVSDDQAVYNHRLDYIKGEKADENKMSYVKLDKEWRKKHQIRNYYKIL